MIKIITDMPVSVASVDFIANGLVRTKERLNIEFLTNLSMKIFSRHLFVIVSNVTITPFLI